MLAEHGDARRDKKILCREKEGSSCVVEDRYGMQGFGLRTNGREYPGRQVMAQTGTEINKVLLT